MLGFRKCGCCRACTLLSVNVPIQLICFYSQRLRNYRPLSHCESHFSKTSIQPRPFSEKVRREHLDLDTIVTITSIAHKMVVASKLFRSYNRVRRVSFACFLPFWTPDLSIRGSQFLFSSQWCGDSSGRPLFIGSPPLMLTSYIPVRTRRLHSRSAPVLLSVTTC